MVEYLGTSRRRSIDGVRSFWVRLYLLLSGGPSLTSHSMIWAAVVVGKGGDFEVTEGKTVGLFVGLLVVHGILVRRTPASKPLHSPHLVITT